MRTLLIHGARAVVGTTTGKNLAPLPCLAVLGECGCDRGRSQNGAGEWAMMTRAETYRHLPTLRRQRNRSASHRRCWLARVTKDDGEPVGPGSAEVIERCEPMISSICLATDQRIPSRPAARSPHATPNTRPQQRGTLSSIESPLQVGGGHTRRSAQVGLLQPSE